MLAAGTLVQIKQELVGERYDQSYFLAKVVATDGYLWVIDGPAVSVKSPHGWSYWCRSVATGNLYDFNTDEFTVAPQEQEQEETSC